jgi:spore germination protein YaaH
MKHYALALLTLLALSGLVLVNVESVSASAPSNPDPTHPLVMQQAANQVATARVGTLQPFKAPAPMAAVGGAGGPQREIFGFALASSLSDPTIGYPSWNFSLLTTVAFFGLHVTDNGAIAADSGLTVWNSSATSALVSTAHARATKVVLTIILQDFSAGTPHMCAGLAHAATTIAATVAQVKAKGVDGVNVDYEGLNGKCGTTDPSRAQHSFVSFIKGLRAALPAGSYLSVDTYASSAADTLGFFDVRGLSGSVDSFFVMAYDMEYSNSAHFPTKCTKFCLGPTAPLTGYYYNDSVTATQYMAAVPASKVILGVPYYGRKACVSSATPHQYPTGAVAADGYLDAAGESTAPNVKAGSFAAHRDASDPVGTERWDTWVNTSMNCIRELYWDDAVSLGQKYKLIRNDNLRGVGIWTLNYGGGAPALWGALNTYFACPVAITLPATETTTQFSVGLSAGTCAVSSFEVEQYDTTRNHGWYPVRSAPGTATSAAATSTVADGFPGSTYQFRARAHTTGGFVGAWASASTSVAATATYSHPFKGLYTLDAYGGISPDSSPPVFTAAYWPGWSVARAAKALPGIMPQSGAVLDAYGGLHYYGAPITLTGAPYWRGWDIARDLAFLPNGTGGYVLDGYGGLHPFAVNGHAMPPAPRTTAYWGGKDIARKVVIFSDGTGGYVMDAYGGLHPFGIGVAPPAAPTGGPYWKGWAIARDVVLVPGSHAGYLLDGYGGIHAFSGAKAIATPAYWGWDIGRSVWLTPASTLTAPAGYLMDGFGGLHPFGGAPLLTNVPYWGGHDVARNLTGY